MTWPLWPFFDLAVRTPLLELRYATDELLAAAALVHAEGVVPPGTEPFDGDATFYGDAPEAQRKWLLGHWRARAKTSPEWWHLAFAVMVGGEVVGMQDITGVDFVRLRTVSSFSFLGLRHQRHGIGKEMRAAVVHLAFNGLGALRAESDAFDDNRGSRGVSESLGYEPNGTVLAPRPSGAALMHRHLLTRERWLATGRRDDIEIDGLKPCLAIIGLEPA